MTSEVCSGIQELLRRFGARRRGRLRPASSHSPHINLLARLLPADAFFQYVARAVLAMGHPRSPGDPDHTEGNARPASAHCEAVCAGESSCITDPVSSRPVFSPPRLPFAWAPFLWVSRRLRKPAVRSPRLLRHQVGRNLRRPNRHRLVDTSAQRSAWSVTKKRVKSSKARPTPRQRTHDLPRLLMVARAVMDRDRHTSKTTPAVTCPRSRR